MDHQLLLQGIDEAGLGPRVGPLCVASTLFSINVPSPPPHSHTPEIPNLWHALSPAVCAACDRDKKRIAIDDSKKLLKRAAGHADTSALELGVRAFLKLASIETPTWDDILRAIDCPHAPPSWHHEPLPELAHTISRIAIMANPLHRAAHSSRLQCLALRCTCLDAQALNEGCQTLGSKSAVSFGLVAQLMEQAISTGNPVWITVDRQGGRTDYTRILREHFPYLGIEELRRCPDLSLYRLRQHDGPDCWVEFRVQAETHALPVALASMLAKLVRELRMHQFNSYWCRRVPELKPTAGYGIDAKRWIRDLQASPQTASLATLVRIR